MEFEALTGTIRIAYSKRYLKEEKRLAKKEPELHQLIRDELIQNQDVGDLIPGSGGWRKARVGSPAQGKGKSGGFRFIHLHFGSYRIIYLMDVYPKNEQENISSAFLQYLKVTASEMKDSLHNQP